MNEKFDNFNKINEHLNQKKIQLDYEFMEKQLISIIIKLV